MKRIDSSNARPNANGTGKTGFHDNADLPQQDATYVTPDWLNVIQEELANIIELNGQTLNPNSRRQLYDILATEEGLLVLSQAVEDRIQLLKEQMQDADSSLQQQLSEAVEALQQQLSNLATGLASLYPKVILAGVIKQGDARVINRPANSNISFLDARYAIHITPESPHEAWSLTRNDNSINLSIFNRSGSSRIEYNGSISWSIVQVEGLTSTTGNGTYVYTGTPVVFPILSGESKAFTIIGAGGGGGSSRYVDLNATPSPPELQGQNGQDSYISIDGTTTKYTAGGGKGGVGGVVGDSGQYIDGTAGTGGKWLVEGEYASANRLDGQSGKATAEDHTGAATDTESRGAGGDGANSSLSAGTGFGGGAGEGARLSMTYTNNSNQTQYVRLYVGKGGTGERSLITDDSTPEHYVAGEDGTHGFIRVSSVI